MLPSTVPQPCQRPEAKRFLVRPVATCVRKTSAQNHQPPIRTPTTDTNRSTDIFRGPQRKRCRLPHWFRLCGRTAHSTHTALTQHSHSTHAALTQHSRSTHAALTQHSHSTHTALTQHSHSTHAALTQHSHSTHTALTQHSHSTHTALTQHSRSTHTALTQHSHSTHTALTQHSHSTHTGGGTGAICLQSGSGS